MQDCRGRYRSAGEFVKYMNEPRDGYDAVEWLAKMPESNGNVGMWGTSYAAHVQAGAAKMNPPHLRTAVLKWAVHRTAGSAASGITVRSS